MESKTALPANWNDIPKFKSDTSKWVYFFSNLTEEVWVQLKEILEADYRRQLNFQLLQDGIPVSAGVEEAKVVSYFYFLNFVGCSILSPSCILQTDTQNEPLSIDSLKVASRTKARSSRQYLNGSAFTNFQHVHPTLQIFILKRILNFYTNKKEIQEDISFYLCMSVSTFLCVFSLMTSEFKNFACASHSNYLLQYYRFFGTWALLILLTLSRMCLKFSMVFIRYLRSGTLRIIRTLRSSLTLEFL